jgi:hypothetical protein
MARWAAGAVEGGWEVGFFPSGDDPTNSAFDNVTLFKPARDNRDGIPSGVRVVDAPGMLPGLPRDVARAASLAAVVRTFRPDVIHAQELQHGGYLTERAVSMLRTPPPIVLTIWGSDLSLQALVPAERPKIQRTLRCVDFLLAECDRELRHARRLGYSGEIALQMPVAGGFDLDAAAALRTAGPTSARRTIAVKGYQHFAGRAQAALRALELCGRSLAGYRLALYAVGANEEILARRVAEQTGMELEIVSTVGQFVTHDEMLAVHGRARISIGLSIADGISTSLLEAMIMGSFPVQSDTSCASEWIVDGESGFIVPAEDPPAAAAAIAAALNDDDLVDRAAALNWETVRSRVDFSFLKGQMLELYDRAARRDATSSSELRGSAPS